MSRLIDADALIEKLKRTSVFECVRNSADKNVFEIIADQPTAYNKKKVLAELEFRKSFLTCNGVRINVPVVTLDNAIDIVKRGGVE